MPVKARPPLCGVCWRQRRHLTLVLTLQGRKRASFPTTSSLGSGSGFWSPGVEIYEFQSCQELYQLAVLDSDWLFTPVQQIKSQLAC